MKKTLAHGIATLFIIIGAVMVSLYFPSFWQPFEYKIKDLMLQSRGEIKGDTNIVIVDIDEKSLHTLGQWPWSRDMMATLLQNLNDLGASIIGLDVVFAEADKSSPQSVVKTLGLPFEHLLDYDALFAQTIAQTPTILGYVFALNPDAIEPKGIPKSAAIILEHNRPEFSSLLKPYRPILNIPPLQEAAYSSGYFNTIPDSDGVVRSIPLIMAYDGIIYPSLSLEIARIALEEKQIHIQYDEQGMEHIALGEHRIPTDFFGRMMINYRGSQHSYQYIPAIDVYTKKVDALHVKDKIVLIGTSAAGLLDLRSTPFESVYAGVEVHANAIDNILHQDHIAKPVWTWGVDLLSITLLCLLVFALLLLPSAMLSFITLIVLNTLLIGVHYASMVDYGILFNTVIPILAMNSLFIIGEVINYFLEIKQKELIKHKFASKVSPAVMESILTSGETVLQGIEKEITIFFSDIRRFTALSEASSSPKSLIHLINAYMDPMSQIIIRNEGTVDKFIGDAIMAYWNAPVDTYNHADKAIISALEQLHYLPTLNAKLKENPEFSTIAAMAEEKAMPIIDIGIGINTGIAVVGEMGTENRSDYTVIGDTINLGSRIESLCKYYHARLIISHFTKAQLEGDYILRFLDLVTVKGKNEPVELWQIHDFNTPQKEPLYPQSYEALQKELTSYHEAIALYKEARFEEALHRFKTLEQEPNKSNEGIYTLYRERCEHYCAFPPVAFNGVFIHTSKG